MPEISQYEEESSALIRMYLAGEFGSRPSDVNGYAASAFMPLIATPPIRRCGASGMSGAGWCWPIATRPPTPSIRRPRYRRRSGRISSAGCMIFEYRKLGLPRPDLVVYLDVPTEASVHMLRSREAQTNTHADIHEQDTAYLRSCRESGRQAAEVLGWYQVQCVRNDQLRSIEDIHAEIWRQVEPLLDGKGE